MSATGPYLAHRFLERGCSRDGANIKCECGNVVLEDGDGGPCVVGLIAFDNPVPGLGALHRFDYSCSECGKVYWDAVAHVEPVRIGWLSPGSKTLKRWLKDMGAED